MNLIKFISDKWSKYDIVKEVNGKMEIYLRRYFIFRTKKNNNIYLHNIRRPDEDRDPHDHPWSFISIILNGGYVEHIYDDKGNLTKVNRRNRGSIEYRPGSTVHMIKKVDPNTWTLVLTTGRFRKWGFVTPTGWVYWKTYLGISDQDEIEMD